MNFNRFYVVLNALHSFSKTIQDEIESNKIDNTVDGRYVNQTYHLLNYLEHFGVEMKEALQRSMERQSEMADRRLGLVNEQIQTLKTRLESATLIDESTNKNAANETPR